METSGYYKEKKYKINRFRKEAILDLLGSNNDLVLDIGCNDGSLGEVIKQQKNSKVFGVDISETSVSEAREKLDGVFCFDIQKDYQNWPEDLRQIKFDKIIVSEVLEHLFYPEKLLENLKNQLKEGGEIIITVPNLLFWKNRLKIFFGNFNYTEQGLMDRGHIHFFSWTGLISIIRQAGFSIVDQRHHIPTKGTKILGMIFPGLFAYQFIVKVKRNEN